MKGLKEEIESVLQFAVLLIQLTGLFLVKPHLFALYTHASPFLAGDPGVYLMFIVAVLFLVMSMLWKKRIHGKYWLAATLLAAAGFIVALAGYNKKLENSTFLATGGPGIEVERVIKGDHYRKEITDSCPLFRGPAPVREQDVIMQCADIRDWSEIDSIWPREEILQNTSKLLTGYYLCLILGGVSLTGAIQAIKCYRKQS